MAGLGMIWAQTATGVIGRDGRIPWRLPEDQRWFRALTLGQPVIMGRRTWESLPDRFRPLPERRNLVLSRDPDFPAPGAEVVDSLAAAVRRVGDGPAWVIGGGPVYAEAAAGYATVAEVTEVDVDVSGDTFAPPLTGWTLAVTGDWLTSRTGLRYRHLRYLR